MPDSCEVAATQIEHPEAALPHQHPQRRFALEEPEYSAQEVHAGCQNTCDCKSLSVIDIAWTISLGSANGLSTCVHRMSAIEQLPAKPKPRVPRTARSCPSFQCACLGWAKIAPSSSQARVRQDPTARTPTTLVILSVAKDLPLLLHLQSLLLLRLLFFLSSPSADLLLPTHPPTRAKGPLHNSLG